MQEQIWTVWWAWVVFGLALGILEILVPGYIFLGFAIGAVVTGVIAATGLITALPALLFIFAVASVIAWLVLRRVMGVQAGQVKIWKHDINDNHP